MKYMGSKNRIANEFLPIILKDRQPGQWYVEPFVGGCNVIDKVNGGGRMGNDINKYLIAMFKALQNGWTPPELVTEEMYKDIKRKYLSYPPELVGYVGFSFSFGAKWFDSYRRDKAGQKDCANNMQNQSRRAYESIIKQAENIKDVTFSNLNYFEMKIPENSLIYCDPPYKGTLQYRNLFIHYSFWNWARKMSSTGHTVFISEYAAPDDFECVWSKEVSTTMNINKGKKDMERLFKLK